MKNYRTTEFTLSSDVANSGTFTVAYPTGSDDGDFENAVGHFIVVNGQRLSQRDGEIGLSFGTSSVTVTNLTGAAIIAGKGYMTFMYTGKGSSVDVLTDSENNTVIPKKLNARVVHPLSINLGSPVTADADGILNDVSATDSAQSYDSSDFVTTFTGVLDVPRNLTATGTAGSDHVVTVTGKDEYGQPMSESLTLNGTNVIAGVKAFKQVETISVAAGASGDTFDLGWGDVLGLPVAVRSATQVFREFEDDVIVGGYTNGIVELPWNLDVADLATGTGASYELVAPFDLVIEELVSVVRIAIVTGGALTVKNVTTDVDGLSITVADSATKGTKQTDTPTAGHATTVVTKGSRIQIVAADAFNGGGALNGVLKVRPTGMVDGTLVTALAKNTPSTATTADVRGTYDPATACDGTTSFKLTVFTAEPQDIGNKQYVV